MQQEIFHKQIIGSWTLKSFEIENLDHVTQPWGNNTHGLLIYTDTGTVSVSINKDLATSNTPSSDEIIDSILFYTGTYVINNHTISHQVTEASNPTRIGKVLIRHAELIGDELKLVTPLESFGRAILKWKRIPASKQ